MTEWQFGNKTVANLPSIRFLPPATKLGQGYVFTRVCDSVHRGVCPIACWDTPPPGPDHCMMGYIPRDQRQAPPRDQRQAPPWDQAPSPSPAQCMLGDTGNKWAVRILLECNLVIKSVNQPNGNSETKLMSLPFGNSTDFQNGN